MKRRESQRISEVIVVEGLHDKQAVLEAVDADVWVLGGDRISHRMVAELGRVARARGMIILTDPDGPGERIRRRLADAIPGCRHAFIAKMSAMSHGRVGVENASPDVIRAALRDAKAQGTEEHQDGARAGAASQQSDPFTIGDLQQYGLVGHPHSASSRRRVGEVLGIGYANAKSFVWKLNVLGITRAEWEAALRETIGGQSS